MSRLSRRLLAIAIFIVAAAGIVIGGPLSSGAIWLTWPARSTDGPRTFPAWLEPLHKGHVDFATGLYVREDQDLIVQGGLPLVLRRTYRSEDRVSRAFGIGATHAGEWYLRGDPTNFQWAELILDDGSRIRFDRTSRGSSYLNAMFRHETTPSAFFGAQLGWTGLHWALRWYDGSSALFRACGDSGPDLCSIAEYRSPAGHKIYYRRDRSGTELLEMRSGDAGITFDYDQTHRIVRASDGHGHDVRYEYDAGGRLARVIESAGRVRNYTYDARGAMLTIDEPGWHIENSFDSDGRMVRQLTVWPERKPYFTEIAYKAENGVISETDVSENNGPHTIYRFDADHYQISETHDATGPAPAVVTIDRNAFSRFVIGLTVRCYGTNGKVVHKAAYAPMFDDESKDELVAETCR